MAEAEVVVRPSAGAAAELAAEVLVGHLSARLDDRERVSLGLSGGSTPVPLYRRLANRSPGLDWARIDLFQVDERCVPPEDEASNLRLIRRTLTAALGRQGPRLHPIRSELTAEAAAREYAALLSRRIEGSPPRLDAVVLGVGADGHTASIFADTMARSRGPEPWVLATVSPAGPRHRVSLSLPLLKAADLRLVLVTGASKRQIVARLLGGSPDRDLPAARLSGSRGRTVWVLDREAALDLVVA